MNKSTLEINSQVLLLSGFLFFAGPGNINSRLAYVQFKVFSGDPRELLSKILFLRESEKIPTPVFRFCVRIPHRVCFLTLYFYSYAFFYLHNFLSFFTIDY